MSLEKLEVESCKYYTKGECPLEAKRLEIAAELQDIKEEVAGIKSDVQEIVTLFRESQAVVNFAIRFGKLTRWLAATIASIAAVWASINYWKSN